MEAICSSETSVSSHPNTMRYTPEERTSQQSVSQSVHLGVESPLWAHDNILSLKSVCYSHNGFRASSLTRGRICPLADVLVLLSYITYKFIYSGLYTRMLSTNYQSQSHVTTDDQSVSGSWFRAPSGAHDQMLITVWQLLFFFFSKSGDTSDERSGQSFDLVTWTASVQWSKFPAGPRQHSISPYL
jgi:hypothetical protein